MKRMYALRAAPLLFLGLTAMSGYYVTASANRILPVGGSLEPGAEIEVAKGDVFYSQPVGAAYIATLGKDVSLTIAGKQATLAEGTRLNVARVAGDAADRIDGHHGVFCAAAENNWNGAKGMANLLTLGLFAAGQRHSVNTQFCILDSDGDGQADRAFLAGANRKEDREPVAIEPTPVTVARDVPLPELSEARLRFAGGVGILGNLGVDLELVENGKPLVYGNGRTLLKKSSLPRDVTVFGSSFTILSYDPERKVARIRWNRPFNPGEYRVNTTRTTTYIPIYVRR